jgi:glycosyltransferase involved in cell wall biosynthesis
MLYAGARPEKTYNPPAPFKADMKVLYLAQHQRFSGDHAGFAHVSNFTKALSALGPKVVLAAKPPEKGSSTPEAGPNLELRLVEWELEYPLPFGPLPRLRPQLDWAEPARALRWVKRVVKEDGIDIIQERHEMRLDLGPLSTRFLGVPSVLEVNSPFIEEAFPEGSFSFRSRNFFRRLGFDSASAIVVQTALLKKIISRHTGTPVHVIPNGADPALFRPGAGSASLRKKLGLGGSVVGFAGAFHPWHGAPDLVEAFARLKRPGAQLLMLGGGGDDLEKCRVLARKAGIEDRVVFTGKVPYAELPGYLDLCDVLAAPFSPGKDEKRAAVFERYGLWWCPLKLFEYMAMGKPVVASSVGVIPGYVEGAGLLYPEGDPAALAERLEELLADGAKRERLGKAGRKLVEEKYNWTAVARQTLRLYEAILGAPKTV